MGNRVAFYRGEIVWYYDFSVSLWRIGVVEAYISFYSSVVGVIPCIVVGEYAFPLCLLGKSSTSPVRRIETKYEYTDYKHNV